PAAVWRRAPVKARGLLAEGSAAGVRARASRIGRGGMAEAPEGGKRRSLAACHKHNTDGTVGIGLPERCIPNILIDFHEAANRMGEFHSRIPPAMNSLPSSAWHQ